MERKPITSSNVASAGYENGTLELEFKGGGVYRYHDVPQHVYDGLLAADSKGSFVHENIKRFRHTKV